MSREKQMIEEMAEVYYKARLKARETLGSMNEGEAMWYSKAFYNSGYRKQSEWISVEERLPTENGDYLVYTKYGYIEVESYEMWDDDDLDGGYWWGFEGYVTHWMYLPEAPKGGAE